MSHGKGFHLDHHMVEGAAGAAAELVKQGGYLSSQAGNTAYRALTGTHLGQAGICGHEAGGALRVCVP